MDADPAALGFLKPEKYAAVERERRWLCAGLPDLPVLRAEAIEDLYVDGSARSTGRSGSPAHSQRRSRSTAAYFSGLRKPRAALCSSSVPTTATRAIGRNADDSLLPRHRHPHVLQ